MGPMRTPSSAERQHPGGRHCGVHGCPKSLAGRAVRIAPFWSDLPDSPRRRPNRRIPATPEGNPRRGTNAAPANSRSHFLFFRHVIRWLLGCRCALQAHRAWKARIPQRKKQCNWLRYFKTSRRGGIDRIKVGGFDIDGILREKYISKTKFASAAPRTALVSAT